MKNKIIFIVWSFLFIILPCLSSAQDDFGMANDSPATIYTAEFPNGVLDTYSPNFGYDLANGITNDNSFSSSNPIPNIEINLPDANYWVEQGVYTPEFVNTIPDPVAVNPLDISDPSMNNALALGGIGTNDIYSDAGLVGPAGDILQHPVDMAIKYAQDTNSELSSVGLADITTEHADINKIDEITRPFQDLDPKERLEIVKDRAGELRDAGAITVFVGDSYGEVSVVDNLDKYGTELVDYYPLGTYMDNRTYYGLFNQVMAEMTQYPQNATPVNILESTDIIQIGLNGPMTRQEAKNAAGLIYAKNSFKQGTVVEVAPNTFLTAGHVVSSLKEGSNINIGFEPYKILDLETFYSGIDSSGELKEEKNIKYPDIIGEWRPYVDTKGQYLGKPIIKENDLAQYMLSDILYSKDVAAFTINNPQRLSVIKTGDSIPIMAISDTLPEKGEKVGFYGRPITHELSNGSLLYSGEADFREVKFLFPEQKDLYAMSGTSVSGWSGSGVYSTKGKTELKGILIEHFSKPNDIVGKYPIAIGGEPLLNILGEISYNKIIFYRYDDRLKLMENK